MRVARQSRFHRILGRGTCAGETLCAPKGSSSQGAAEPALPGRHAPSPLRGEAASAAQGGYRVLNPSKQVLSTISMICSWLYSPDPLRKPSTGSQARAYRV